MTMVNSGFKGLNHYHVKQIIKKNDWHLIKDFTKQKMNYALSDSDSLVSNSNIYLFVR